MRSKRHAVLLMLVLFVVGIMAHALAAGGYLANTKSGKYHISTCRTIKHPNAAHFVSYNTEKECIAAGYVRCKVCFR